MPDGFVHLHLHSEYSLLDGACRIKDLVARTKALGQSAVAVTDHGSMFGILDFYNEARQAGIRPIIGCEVYLAQRTRHDRVHDLDGKPYHLVLLCENGEGYHNLLRLVSFSYTEGFYIKPRVDHELLRKYSGGLICLSACIAGKIPRLILGGDYEGAKDEALLLSEIFGPGNFFLELQDHGLSEQKPANRGILRLAAETGLPLVVTNDAHYTEKKDAAIQDVLMCIQTNRLLSDEDRMRFETEEFYIKSGAEMAALFPDTPEAIENTAKIAARCEVNLGFSGYIQPRFPLPEGEKSAEGLLRRLCAEGFSRRYGGAPPAGYQERLDYELSVITQMGYCDYYLIVADYVNRAREMGIPVGPGRGSGAGSIAAYALGITNICPMRYGLIFERFLNPERISMPDFDIDFCPRRRGEIIDYMVEKYGQDRVTQIITFGTMAARAAIRDSGRVMSVPIPQVDALAKLVPGEIGITLDRALEKSPDLKAAYDSDEGVKKLIDIARGLEGMPRNASTHAAGLVVTPEPAYEYIPLAKNDEVVVTQYSMNGVSELGLVKMDFLGLRNLTIIDDTVKLIRRHEPEFDIDKIPDDDKKTYEMLTEGRTSGVFQLESSGMKGVAMGLKAQSIEEITACIALFRPGPMEQIPKFIDCKHNPEHVTYRHPLLREILKDTYGCPIYQEQVMEIFRRLAGYSMGRADIVRSAISKKKTDILEKERQNFIYGNKEEGIPGCMANGVSEAVAKKLFEEVLEFGGYAFPKAHSAAYAIVSYQTAYLKCNFPGEYMGALLSSVLGNTPKVAEYISECKNLGIEVLRPDVNSSEDGFIVEDGNIRFGLEAVKNVGHKLILDLVAEREENGKFKSFADFCRRMARYDFNRRAADGLIRCGACDSFGLRRSQMLGMFELLMDAQAREKDSLVSGQMGLFGEEEEQNSEPEPPDLPEFSPRELLEMEKEAAGIYLSGHPLDSYREFFDSAGVMPLGEITGGETDDDPGETGVQSGYAGDFSMDGRPVSVGGIIASVKQKTTKNGDTMAFVTLEDLTGAAEVIVFPKTLSACGGYLRKDNIVLIRGRISVRPEEEPKIICGEASLAREGETAPAPSDFGFGGSRNGRDGAPGQYSHTPEYDGAPGGDTALTGVERASGNGPDGYGADRAAAGYSAGNGSGTAPRTGAGGARGGYHAGRADGAASRTVGERDGYSADRADGGPDGAKVWLRIHDDGGGALLTRLKGLLTMFPGDRQVILYYPESGKRLSAGAGLGAGTDERLYAELRRLLGKENVVVK